jgi:hypothetical protein
MRWTVGVLWIGLVAIKNPMPLELIRQKYMMKHVETEGNTVPFIVDFPMKNGDFP